jgi:hypothetical protein
MNVLENHHAKAKSPTAMMKDVTAETRRTQVITDLASSSFPSAICWAMNRTEADVSASTPKVEANANMKLSMVKKPRSASVKRS